MKGGPLVWSSDLGKASTEAGRHGSGLFDKASLPSPTGLPKKGGLRKPRMEVIVSTFQQKRLGSSQPIVAARLVLIRALYSPKPAASSKLWKK